MSNIIYDVVKKINFTAKLKKIEFNLTHAVKTGNYITLLTNFGP